MRYRLRQKMFSIGDDFYIENDQGERVYKVDGKVLRVRRTLVFEDMHGTKLATIQERKLRLKETMEVEDANGKRLALIKKAMITPLRERWDVEVEHGPDLDVQGNIFDHEYRFSDGRHTVAEVSKQWFRIRDTYGVDIAPGYDDLVILASAVAIDAMAHGDR